MHNLVTCGAHVLPLVLRAAGDQCRDVSGFRAFLSVVDHLDALVWVWLTVRQVCEQYTLVVLGAVIEDGEHVSV